MGQHQELFGLDAELPETNASGAPSTNRINSDSQGYGYSYDSAGNMTTGMGQSYSYDGANRLKTASNGTSSYGYDGDGKRVKKTENGATTYYVYSSKLGQSVMEVNSSSVQRAYVYGGGKLVAMQATDGQFYWLHTNHLGNSRAMTDSSGNLTYKGQFDPYGATLTEWSGSGNTNLNSKKFTGYERDSATGLDYAQARMYNSSRGRFMTADMLGLRASDVKKPQTLNRYTYSYNDPVNFIDPTGLTPSPAELRFLCELGIVGSWWCDGGTVVRASGGIGRAEGQAGGGISVGTIGSNQQGRKVALNREDQRKYNLAKADALKFSDQCTDALKRAGFSMADLTDAINKQKPYDGLRSTINVVDAGVIPDNFSDPKISNATLLQVDLFFQVAALSNHDAAAMTGIFKESTRYDVYYDPSSISSRRIIHEALHSLSRLNDADLAKRLGRVDQDKRVGSDFVNDYLFKHDCGSN